MIAGRAIAVVAAGVRDRVRALAPDDSAIVAAARAWSELGFTPMAAHGKRPLAAGWQSLDAAEHLARIVAEPPEQIGIRMGAQRDGRILIAIDVDGDEGKRSLIQLMGELGELPQTCAQRTGGGGMHLVFEWPSSRASECPTTSAGKLGAKLDIRGERGHIVAAPSLHESGRRYELLNAEGTAPVLLPAPWVDRIVERHRPPAPATNGAPHAPAASDHVVERCRRYVARMDPAISGSGGHQATWRVAQVAVRAFALDRVDAMRVMREFNAGCQPPWSERELAHKLDSAETHSRMPHGYLLERDDGWRAGWDAEPSKAEPGIEQPGEPVQRGREDWRSLLKLTAGSKERPPTPKRCLENVLTTLLHCPAWQGVLRYDEFGDRVLVAGELPRAEHHDPRCSPGAWREGHSAWAASWFHDVLGFEPSIDWVERAVDEVARSNGFHPVHEYFRGLCWDGRPRLDAMLVEYFGAEDSEVVRAVGAKWMISAVARVMRPGCQVDHMLVLEGQQGTRKSTALRTLVGDDWFRNSPIDLRNKDAAMALRGCWIYEFDELDAFRGRDATRIKSFITGRVDSYRPSYGRRVIDVPRQCAFAGSTNEERYLVDPTGNRRFWPVRCGAIDIPGLVTARDQLWAEAHARHSAGELWYVDSPAIEARLRDEQREREEIDPWVGLVQAWLERLHETKRSEGVTTEQALTVGLDMMPGSTTRRDETRMGHCLRALGWVRQRAMRDGARGYRYYPIALPVPPVALPVPYPSEAGRATCN